MSRSLQQSLNDLLSRQTFLSSELSDFQAKTERFRQQLAHKEGKQALSKHEWWQRERWLQERTQEFGSGPGQQTLAERSRKTDEGSSTPVMSSNNKYHKKQYTLKVLRRRLHETAVREEVAASQLTNISEQIHSIRRELSIKQPFEFLGYNLLNGSGFTPMPASRSLPQSSETRCGTFEAPRTLLNLTEHCIAGYSSYTAINPMSAEELVQHRYSHENLPPLRPLPLPTRKKEQVFSDRPPHSDDSKSDGTRTSSAQTVVVSEVIQPCQPSGDVQIYDMVIDEPICIGQSHFPIEHAENSHGIGRPSTWEWYTPKSVEGKPDAEVKARFESIKDRSRSSRFRRSYSMSALSEIED